MYIFGEKKSEIILECFRAFSIVSLGFLLTSSACLLERVEGGSSRPKGLENGAQQGSWYVL